MSSLVIKYINYARACINSDKFRNYFIIKNNKKINLLQNGKLSCAKFVSEVLYKFKIISQVHLTVESTLKDMKNCGWKKKGIEDLKIGDVIVWEKNKKAHYHIGFYIENKIAISNSEKYRCPREHHLTYRGKRFIKWVFEYVP